MNRDINDLFTITPTTAKILLVLANNPLSGGMAVSRKSKICRGGIYIHLHRLCQMDYVRKKGYKYELTSLGQSVIFAFKIFEEHRNEHRQVSTTQPKHRIAESNSLGGS